MESLFTIHTESDLSWSLYTEEISLIDQVNIKGIIDSTKHKKENNNSVTMEQGSSFDETRMN